MCGLLKLAICTDTVLIRWHLLYVSLSVLANRKSEKRLYTCVYYCFCYLGLQLKLWLTNILVFNSYITLLNATIRATVIPVLRPTHIQYNIYYEILIRSSCFQVTDAIGLQYFVMFTHNLQFLKNPWKFCFCAVSGDVYKRQEENGLTTRESERER